MAIYEFNITFLPYKNFNKKFKLYMPLYLWDYGNGTELDMYCGYNTDYDYWKGYNLDNLENILKQEFIIQDEPWSEKISYYGYEKGIRIEIDHYCINDEKNISMGINVKKINYIFIEKILNIFSTFDMIIVIADTGKIISLDYNNFIKILHNSKRYKRFSNSCYAKGKIH